MNQRVRDLLLKTAVVTVAALTLLSGCSTSRQGERSGGARSRSTSQRAATTPWPIAVQAYTFRKVTLLETADRLQELGVKHIELYPGQTIGGTIAGKTHHSMDAPTRQGLLDALGERGIKPVAYGVVNGKDAADWESIFQFAQGMGIGVICCEPKEEDLDLVAGLCDTYDIRAALHNHAEPSRYWNPKTVLEAVSERTARLGACVDNGHWARSGLDGVEGLKTLEGRIHNVHLKDIDIPSKAGRCVPFGTGTCNVPGLIAVLRQQNYNGLVSLEYESSPDNPSPDLRACLDFLQRCVQADTATLLAGSIRPVGMSWDPADTWRDLDQKDDGRWQQPEVVDAPGYIDTTDDGKGAIEASGLGFDNEHYPNAFDNSLAKWCFKAPTIWVQYQYPEGERRAVTAYTITTANDAPERDPKDWRLLGSNDDGETWTTVDPRSDQSWSGRHTKRLFEVKDPGEFNLYRLHVSKNHGSETSQLSEIELLAPAPAEAMVTPASIDERLRLAEDGKGFQALFTEDLQSAVMQEGGWAWEDGVLVAKGKGDLWTEARYADFVLDLEFQCEDNTNSGVFLRCANIKEWLHTAIEVQILQPDSANKRHICGAVFDCLAPVTNAIKPAGQWNRYVIVALGSHIVVHLNGMRVLDMDLNQWTEPGRNPDGSKNKFRSAYRDMPRQGHIGLQYHGQPVRFRNLRIKPLK